MSALVVPAKSVNSNRGGFMAKTKVRKLKKVHVPAHTKKVGNKKVKVREHYRSTPE